MSTAQRWLCVASALLLACSGESNTPDASTPTDMEPVEDLPPPPPPPPPPPADVPRDTGVTRQFGDPCTAANQCPGRPAAVCLRESTDAYPNGLCTRTCDTDADCGDSGACLAFNSTYPRLCFPLCGDHSDCRPGYRCFVGRSSPEARVCFPFCSTDAHCPGSSCNVYSRFCGTGWMTRADNGEPCEQGTCRGTCSAELNSDGTPTGNLDGICTSRCANPPDSEYNGANLPRGDCPTGSVCVRASGATADAPTATCRKECQSSTDCRPGYICSRPSRPGRDAGTYGNGYCVAMNCHFMTQVCPPNATCRTLRSDDAGVPTSGVCERRAGDGGATPADGAVDATATDVPRDAPSATDAGAPTDAQDAAGRG